MKYLYNLLQIYKKILYKLGSLAFCSKRIKEKQINYMYIHAGIKNYKHFRKKSSRLFRN